MDLGCAGDLGEGVWRSEDTEETEVGRGRVGRLGCGKVRYGGLGSGGVGGSEQGRGRYEVRSVVRTGWCGSGGGSERFGVQLEDVMRLGDVRGGYGLVGERVEGR